MLFNSWVYAIFLPVVLVVYYHLNHRWQNYFLLAASYLFYGWWDWRFCGLLALSTVVDFNVAKGLGRTADPRRRKLLLAISIVVDMGILAFFKYFNFFVDTFGGVMTFFGLHPDLPTLRIILPVGISFYTFQTMSYVIDVYRGELKPARRLWDYALYLTFFPQLVAGPIERAPRLLPQIEMPRVVSWEQITSGCVLILIGLFRKVAIADGVAPLVNQVFSQAASSSSAQLLVGLYLFSLQIYGDFAGYSDIARGTSRLLGVELIENFQHPYFSTSITEFWRRWHVSLSSWLRDYLYIPLGGNRRGKFRTYVNLMLTMLLGGLWHGANWTFVVWGGLHGVYLAVHKLILGDRKPQVENRSRTPRGWAIDILKMIFTFHLVALTWIFFRSKDFGSAWTYLAGILHWSGSFAEVEGLSKLIIASVLLFSLDALQYAKRNHTAILEWPALARGAAYATLALMVFALRSDGEIPFIYFQF